MKKTAQVATVGTPNTHPFASASILEFAEKAESGVPFSATVARRIICARAIPAASKISGWFDHPSSLGCSSVVKPIPVPSISSATMKTARF